jgi:eukaryotic-like serine/threonine-protein kinase
VSAASVPLLPPDRYELGELLAAGGFGEVWRGTDLALGRPVAVKVLHRGLAYHPETMARFRAEARHAASLSHENIARVYDYGEPPDAQAPFLVMELVDGPSLAGVLTGGPLDAATVTDIVAQTAAGLDAAHRAGLVHRDIKPGNLLIRTDGRVKITDFGISYAAGSAPLTSTGQLVGTPGYLAPERVRGGRASAASDLYSLGIVAWECLTGSVPFTGTAVEVAIAHRDRALPPLPASVPAEVAALVGELTAKNPAFRPATAGDLAVRAAELRDRLAAGELPRAAGTPAALAHTIEMAELPELAGTGTGSAARRGRRRGAALARPLWAAAGAVAVVATVAGVLLSGALGHPAAHRSAALAAGPATPSAAAVTIEVSGRSLIGQPVSQVVSRLRQLGLKVVVHWELTGAQSPGQVVSVQPAGLLPPGSTVTITGSLRPASQAPAYARPPAGSVSPPASARPSAPPTAPASPPAQPAPSGSSPVSSSGPPGTTGSPAPPASPAPTGTPGASDPPDVLALS